MAGKRFRGSLFGYEKASVDTYLENLTRDYEERLTSKDLEIEKAMSQLKKVNEKYEELKLEEERIYTEKEKISKALVSANDQAEKIVEDAKKKVAEEVEELERRAEREREKIVDIKSELIKMKKEAADVIERCRTTVDSIILDEPVNDEIPEEPVEAENETEIEKDAAAKDEEEDDFFG